MKTIFVWLVLAGVAFAQEAPPPPKSTLKPQAAIELAPTEIDGVGWMLDALSKYSEHDRTVVRFVQLPHYADAEWIGMMDFAVNAACSQSPLLVKADVFANGFLLGYNLERLCPDPVALKRLIATWDELAVRDSRFHVPELNLEKGKTKAAILAPHLQEAALRHVGDDRTKDKRIDVIVTQITKSTGAIYPAEFLLEQLLTSVRGKYPEFRQINFKAEKMTPLQSLLRSRGFFFEQSQDGLGDKGAILIASDITGKNRIVLTSYGLNSRQPLAVTFDTKDLRNRASEQFFRNVIEFEKFHDASEVFIPMTNGLIEYVLADGQGNIQRVAPPDVAADFTKPRGFTTELEMGMSCISCHFPDGGYKLARNDMEFLLSADVDFIGHDPFFINSKNEKVLLSKAQAVTIAASRYGEPIYEADGILGRAERDFARTIAQLTKYPIKADGQNGVVQLGATIRRVYSGWRFTKIDAERKCLELGVKVPPGQGLAVFCKLCPPPEPGVHEDIMIGLLRAGASIKRDDDEAIHVELARRAAVTRATLLEEPK